MNTLFETAALTGLDWLKIMGVGLAAFLIVEIEKGLRRRKAEEK